MKKMSSPIVFFGSGPVAAESLLQLSEHFTIEAVVTKPRAAHHKGDVPVLRIAESLELPIHTVTNKKSLDTLIETCPFQSKLAILIDFGIIVSQAAIDYFPKGIVNSHFSLLPEWRGADPISFAILSGQKTTGVSLMLLTAGMDEGPLLAQAPYDIAVDDTTPSLTDALIELSTASLVKIIPLYLEGTVQPAPQEAVSMSASKEPTYSRKLDKSDGILDWNKPADVLEREIRAFLEWPKSRGTIAGFDIVVTKAHSLELTGVPGTVAIEDKQIIVYCGQKALAIDLLKPAGKKEMTSQAFLAGHKNLF